MIEMMANNQSIFEYNKIVREWQNLSAGISFVDIRLKAAFEFESRLFLFFFLYYNDSKKVDNDYNSMIMIMIFTKLWMSLEEVILILIFCRSHNIHSFIHLQASSITGLLALTWCVSYEKHTLNLFIEIKNMKKAKYFNRWIKTNMAK